VVRTVWIQRTGEAAYVQRHLPTGGIEIHFPIGGHPQLLGPLTGPEVEVVPAHTTIVGVRFQPGTPPLLPAVPGDLADQRLGLAELWGSSVDRLVEATARTGTPERALMLVQAHLLQESPRPRRHTKPSRAARERRPAAKRRTSGRKRLRGNRGQPLHIRTWQCRSCGAWPVGSG
jgi:hypothetical protein